MERKILVTGATGKQGRALIASLQSASGSPPEFQILALTRSITSPAANALKAYPNVQLVQGDLDKPETVRKVFGDEGGKGSIWGMYVVLAFPGLGADASGEERQGKLCADLALEYEVSHYVFSSVERGGEIDDKDAILDRKVKINIENHVKSLGDKGLKWTILRPGFFMENLEGLIGSIAFTVLQCGLKPGTKIDLVAANDIGRLGAAVFRNSERCIHKIYPVTSEVTTISEIDASYVRATKKHHPSVPKVLARTLLSINKATKELPRDFERIHNIRAQDPDGVEGYLKEARELLPDMTSYEAWVQDKQKPKTDSQEGKNWNQVSIWKLVTGRH